MIKKKLISTAGLTLIEILIGVVVSSIMMAAIYTTYSVVNTTYGQVFLFFFIIASDAISAGN